MANAFIIQDDINPGDFCITCEMVVQGENDDCVTKHKKAIPATVLQDWSAAIKTLSDKSSSIAVGYMQTLSKLRNKKFSDLNKEKKEIIRIYDEVKIQFTSIVGRLKEKLDCIAQDSRKAETFRKDIDQAAKKIKSDIDKIRSTITDKSSTSDFKGIINMPITYDQLDKLMELAKKINKEEEITKTKCEEYKLQLRTYIDFIRTIGVSVESIDKIGTWPMLSTKKDEKS